jgi:hypothetical protein
MWGWGVGDGGYGGSNNFKQELIGEKGDSQESQEQQYTSPRCKREVAKTSGGVEAAVAVVRIWAIQTWPQTALLFRRRWLAVGSPPGNQQLWCLLAWSCHWS